MAKIAKRKIGAAVLVFAGMWWLVGLGAERQIAPEAGDTKLPLTVSTIEPGHAASSIPQLPAGPPRAVAIKTGDDGWDRLSSLERIRILEAQLDESLADTADGDRSAVGRASDALTALRAELCATPEGRVRHASYEARLDEAMNTLDGKDPQ